MLWSVMTILRSKTPKGMKTNTLMKRLHWTATLQQQQQQQQQQIYLPRITPIQVTDTQSSGFNFRNAKRQHIKMLNYGV